MLLETLILKLANTSLATRLSFCYSVLLYWRQQILGDHRGRICLNSLLLTGTMSSFTTPTSLSAGNSASMTCIEDLLPRPRKLQAPAIRTEVKQRASSIFEKRNKLKELLDDHGSTFEKRWMRNKKSEQKRIEVLTKVYHTIPRRRLLPPPPLGTRGQDVDDAFRKACLCPTINISDLIIGDVVLESIYHRANNDPCEFVIIDLLNTSIERHGFTPLPVNNNFRMMILDQRSPNDYGNIVPAVASDNRNSIELELGLLVFEIQDFIYAFHLVLLQEILTPEFHQLQKSPAGSMAAGFSERIMDRWPSLSETQLRASYQPTSRADLRLEILASTQRDEQINFVADLCEDPRSLIAFVADMQKRANSMPPMLAEHPGILDPAHAFATRAVLCPAMEWVLIWNYISCQFGRLVKLEQAGALYDLSGGFTDLASAVFLTLEMYFDKYFLSLYSFKVLTAEPQDNCRTLTAEQKTTAEAMAELKRLVQQLPAARHRTFNGLTVIASEIQKILDGNSDVLSGIEQGNLRAIMQASLLAELRRHLQLLRPIGIPASAAAIQIAKAEEWCVKAYTIQNMTSRVELYCTEHSLDPEDPMFKYPAIPKTEPSKERQRAARAAHDAFWNGLD